MTSQVTPSTAAKPGGQTLLSPLFVACGSVLLAAALGLRPAMKALAEHYRKESIAIRRPLAEFDVSRMPAFRRVPDAAAPGTSTEDVGTEEYTWIGLADETTDFEGHNRSLLVTYYSDPEDKVPHTPEVCYRQGGTVVTGLTTTTLDTPGLSPETPRIKVRVMQLDQTLPAARGALAYVFCANGEFCHNREQVRWIIARPGERHIYFAKIEATAHCSSDAGPDEMAKGIERAKRLLAQALPVLLGEHFPTRDQLSGK